MQEHNFKSANELFSVESALEAEVLEDTCCVVVKGFASVETIDRGNDYVPAAEFNVDSFMAKPALMYNHKFWIDNNGNEIAIGAVDTMFVAELYESENPELYDVYDVSAGEVRDTLPVDKAPDIGEGTRGLWVVASVSVSDVSEMVRRGEINAFSWRGLSRVKFVPNLDGTEQKVLMDIDLFEISLVNIPANGQATLTIEKSEGVEYSTLDGYTVHSMKMEQSRFSDDSEVTEYLETHNLSCDEIKTDGNAYFSVQKSLSEFIPESLVSLRLANGVSVVAGRLNPKSAPPRGWAASEVSLKTLTHYSNLLTSCTEEFSDMAIKKSTRKKSAAVAAPEVVETAPVETDETVEVSDETTEATPTQEVVEEKTESVVSEVAEEKMDAVKEPLPDALQGLAEYVSKATCEAVSKSFEAVLKTPLEEIASAMGGVNEAVKSLNEKMVVDVIEDTLENTTEAATDNTETETEESSDADTEVIASKSEEVVGGMVDAMSAIKEQLNAISKSFSDTVRDEDISKQANKITDPNSCFDNLWPFTSR